MGLIKCPECGREISSQARSCPGCGYPIVKDGMAAKGVSTETVSDKATPVSAKKGGCLKGCLIVIIAVSLFFGIIIALFRVPENKAMSGTKSGALAEETVLTKEELGEFDKKVWEQTVEVIRANNSMMEFMNAYAEEQASELEFYNACKESSEYCAKASVSFPKGSSEDEKSYVKSCETLALYVQKTADSLKKYLDTKATKDLSKAQESIESTQQALSIVAGNRGVFLTKSGFSEEEVKVLVDKMSEELGE